MSTVTLEVTPEMAAWYETASDAKKRELLLLIQAYFRELASPHEGDPLLESMKRLSQEAQANGLTEEILAELLADE